MSISRNEALSVGGCGYGIAAIAMGVGFYFLPASSPAEINFITGMSTAILATGVVALGSGLFMFHRVRKLKKEEPFSSHDQQLLDRVAGTFVNYGNDKL